jgi:hypothetical protein
MILRRTFHVLTVSIILLVTLTPAPALTAQRAMQIGTLWDVFGPSGEEGWGGQAMVWPGGYWKEEFGSENFSKSSTSYKAFLYGVRDFQRPDISGRWQEHRNVLDDVPPNIGDIIPYYVVQRDIKNDPGANGYQLIKGDVSSTHRYTPTTVVVDGVQQDPTQDADIVDPSLPAAAKIVSTWRNNIGIETTRTIYAFVHPDHDDYHIWHYNFTNTGKYCCGAALTGTGDGLASHTNTLHDFMFSHSLWYMDRAEGGRLTGASGEYYHDGLLDYQGHDRLSGSPTGVVSDVKEIIGTELGQDLGTAIDYGDLRVMYGWDGDAPNYPGNDAGDPQPETGRMYSARWPGIGLVHVDMGPSNSSDDSNQPQRFDYENHSNIPQYSLDGMRTTYETMMLGGSLNGNTDRWERSAVHLGVPYGYGAELKYRGPESVFSVGGENWDLAPGESVNVIYVSAVGGIPYQQAVEWGQEWIDAGGESNTEAEQLRLTRYYSLQDSLFTILRRAQDMIEPEGTTTSSVADLEARLSTVTELATPPPPGYFHANSDVERIDLSWGWELPPTAVADITGYRIYRATGSYVGDQPFRLIYEGSLQEYSDTEVTGDSLYFYYVVSVNTNGTESSQHVARTMRPALAVFGDAVDVSGTIHTTTWPAATYRIGDPTAIPVGDTLTIDPGATLLFHSDGKIIVEGVLYAMGAETDSIFVRSIGENKGAFEIQGEDSRATFSYARFDNGFGDIEAISGARLTITDAVLDSDVEYNRISVSSESHIEMADCISQRGVRLRFNSTANLTRSVIEGSPVSLFDNCAIEVDSCDFNMADVQIGVQCTGTIKNSTFNGLGVSVSQASLLEVLNSEFTGGQFEVWPGRPYSDGAIIATHNSFVTLVQCLITDCTVEGNGGAVVSVENSDIAVVNCTIVGNTATGNGGGVFADSGAVQLVNTIVRDNGPTNMFIEGRVLQPSTLEYCNIEGGWPGFGNIDTDPLFVDAESGDYTLQPGSPCIDTGSPMITDFDEGSSDMGYTGGGGPTPEIPYIVIRTPIIKIIHHEILVAEVANGGTADLTITGITLPDSFTTADMTFPISLTPGDSTVIALRYEGVIDTVVTAIIEHNDQNRQGISVELRGLSGTSVSGNVSGVWTAAGSPYRVQGPINVDMYSQLDIEPGADVLFDIDVPFIVEGELQALGTETDSIRFLPGRTYEWGGIRFNDANSSRIQYGRISGAVVSDGEHESHPDYVGAGIYAAGTRLRLNNVVISNNRSLGYGGGIAADSSSSMTLHDCTIANNQAELGGGGAESRNDSWILLIDCEVTGNRAENDHGGGIRIGPNADATMNNTLFAGNIANYTNYGGAIAKIGPGIAGFIDSKFTGNIGYYGAAVWIDGTDAIPYKLWNSVFVDNIVRHSEGGVVQARGGADVDITNCTFSGSTYSPNQNTAAVYVSTTGTSLNMVNVIVKGENLEGVIIETDRGETSPVASVEYCNLPEAENIPGRGMIDTDPMFADTLTGDYTLLPGSPCIDTGSPYLLDTDSTRSDMGYTGGGGPNPEIPRIEVSVDTLIIEAFDIVDVFVKNTGWTPLTVEVAAWPDSFWQTVTTPIEIARDKSDHIRLVHSTSTPISSDLVLTHNDAFQDQITIHIEVVIPVGIQDALPNSTALLPNAPNPFNPTTSVRFSTAAEGHVSLMLYDTFGQRVRTLVDGTLDAGQHSVMWDGTDAVGRPVGSGVYIVRMQYGEFVGVRRMLLLR